MLASFLFFAPAARKRLWVWLLCAGLIALAILLGETRGIWIALAVAVLYLVWFWQRWMVAAGARRRAGRRSSLSPPAIQERFTSIFKPKGVDSNSFAWSPGAPACG